jgi:NADH-quinone oxidoreductase subunit E
MVARRLADESVQPASFAFSAENLKWAEWKIGLYPAGRQQSAVIPLLMRAQEQDGWISRATIENVAKMLGMAYIRVLEVATFYTQFQLQPVGTRAHVQVCGTTPCMLRGAEALIDVCKNKIHHEPHHRTEDGMLSWEEVECAGACVNAPMVQIFADVYEDLTPQRLEEIIDAFHAGQGDTITPGPQVDRLTSAPEGGRVTLLETPTAERTRYVPPAAPVEPSVGAAAPGPAPTTAARPRDVSEETAPAIKGPSNAAKVSQGKAEAERAAANKSAKATGEPNEAMREGAAGAEVEGGMRDGGRAPGKAVSGAESDGAGASSAGETPEVVAPRADPAEVNPVTERGGTMPLFSTPAGPRDDLKLITGVGPVLEAKLNGLGITQWSQVASMSADDIAKIEQSLGFRGRVARDNWLAQAEVLARGGVDEYFRVFGKKPR